MLEHSQAPPWPGLPKTSSEYVTLIAHYYRAEMGRMSGWRDRIDRTTNWAITVAGAMLSVSLSTPTSHHGVLLFAMVLVLLLLVIESRRYRFFDVYRARVRRLEAAGLVTRSMATPERYFPMVLAPCVTMRNAASPPSHDAQIAERTYCRPHARPFPPWLPAKSARVSSLLACCALGRPNRLQSRPRYVRRPPPRPGSDDDRAGLHAVP
jgi:hypothetical protein